MIPWIHLDRTRIPGGGELRLSRRGDEFSIRLGDNELMNSRLRGSEEALATLSLAKIADRKRPKVLIGGLGMGFTLRAALAVLGPEAQVVVAELLPAVVAWARGPMAELFGDCLDDPRVAIEIIDVAKLINSGAGAWDVIMLDVDNGPEAMVQSANDGLYHAGGIAMARRALKPGGILAVWSQGPDKEFAKRLHQGSFQVEEARVRAHAGKSGARHVIWLASAGGPPAHSRRS